jgi:hypothetical protein
MYNRVAIEDFIKQYRNRTYKFSMADIHGCTMATERNMDGIELSYSEKKLSLKVKFDIKDTVDAIDIFTGYIDNELTPTEVKINDFNLNVVDIIDQPIEYCLREIHPFLQKKNVLYAVASNDMIFGAMLHYIAFKVTKDKDDNFYLRKMLDQFTVEQK